MVKQEMAAREAWRTAKTAGKKMRGGKRERFDPLRASRLWLRMRPRVDGELVGLLTGHERAVFTAVSFLSFRSFLRLLRLTNRVANNQQDFHPIYPLIVSGGADGRIRLWQLPPSIFNVTPTWPTPPDLYQHPLPPSSLIHPPVIEPFFSTIHLHPGQWPTQVSFLDSTIPTILSIAPLTHPQASTIPRTSIKISTIDCLSTLPNKSFDSHLASRDLTISQAKRTSKDGKDAPEVIPLKPRLAIEEPDELGFRIEREIVLEGMNCCVGDQIGISRRGPFRLSANTGGRGEQFFVVPTTIDDSEETLEDEKDAAGLYFFRPFTAPSSTADSNGTTTSTNGNGTTTSMNANGTTKLYGIDSSKKDRVSKLFPEDRERSIFDYHTRLRPSSMIKYRPSLEDAGEVRREEGSDEEGSIHFRCVAVSPGRGEWVVAVGDGGRLALWKEESVVEA